MYILALKGGDVTMGLGEFSYQEASLFLAELTGFEREHIEKMYLNRLMRSDSTFSFKYMGGNGRLIEITIKAQPATEASA